MGIGGEGSAFEDEYSVKGCYAYDSGEYKGMAFFGSKGSVKTMALKPLEQNSGYTGAYPLYKPCLKVGENRLFFLIQALFSFGSNVNIYFKFMLENRLYANCGRTSMR